MTQNARKPLPAIPSSARIKNYSKCGCGCGNLTQRTYFPGHDSRLKALMIRVARNVMTLEEVQEWGGTSTREAVEEALSNKALMSRWNVEDQRPEVDEAELEATGTEN